jgi:pimeloyl-ACP methyl ester carboxylesterase
MRNAAHETISSAPAAAPWLVLVHGFSQDRRAFSGQIDAFRDRYRLLLIDLPGHGGSSVMDGPYGHAEFADAVRGTIDAVIDVEAPCTFWGTHTGAAIALLLASRDAGRFGALVLEGAVLPGRPMASVTDTLARIQRIAIEQGIEAARRAWFDESAWFAVMRARPIACRAQAHRRMISDFSGRPWFEPGVPSPVEVGDATLGALALPVLLYNGAHEVADFVAAADHLERVLPRATRRVIADAGGFPGWEFPRQVNQVVADFLDQLAPQSGSKGAEPS